MTRQSKFGQPGWRAAQATLTGMLCAVMIAPPAWAADGVAAEGAGAAGSAIPAETHTAALTQQQKVLHALNRFTFGPRPGDEAAVRKMGLQRWFELQLHPERIDDSAFEAQMEMFPAMQLSQTELMERFPSPQMIRQQMIRQTDAGGAALPGDPVERAVYADAQASYEAQKKKQEEAGGVAAAAGQVSEAKPGAAVSGAVVSGAAASGAAAGGVAAPTHDDEAIMNGAPGMTVEAAGTKKSLKALKHQVPVEPVASEQVEAVLAMAPEQRFQAVVAMGPRESVAFRDALRPIERVRLVQGFTPQQMETVEAMQQPVRVVAAESMETRLLRDVESQRQLQAVMTEFWLNHFNVYVRKNQNEPYYLPAYQREAILPHALGKFEDLLVATAESPAMLMYLDNWESIGPNSLAAQRAEQQAQKRAANGKPAQKMPEGINENYGRELMELHTLGVNGGYTQKDVIEVAKCFTGWTIERPYGGGANGARGKYGMQDDATPGQFVFMENRHEPGPKVVLGHTIPEGGMNEGLEVLHILATSPATAHFISQELAVRFVSDAPTPALVNRMAATFLKSDGDISAVLTTMFHSKEFWSPRVYRAKVKTPVEFLASALRASDATVKNPLPLVQAMDRLGMPVYGMQTPNGYAWTADEWVSSNALISRMNFALVLSGGREPGTMTNWPELLASSAGETGGSNRDVVSVPPDVAQDPTPATEQELEALLLGQPASPRTRATVLAQFSDPTAQSVAETNFNQRPAAAMENQPDAGGFVRARLNAKAGRGQQQFNRPETPLDTMAGLLLGSPDFQRR